MTSLFLVTTLLLGACASVGSRPLDSERGRTLSPAPTFPEITAPLPPGRRAVDELELLERLRDDPGAQLRRAWLLQETGRSASSVQPLNLVIHGGLADATRGAQRAEIEALARWLRARAHAALGDDTRAADDRRAARRGATDPQLLAALQEDAADAADTSAATYTAGSLQTIARAEWGATPPRSSGMAPMNGVERLTVHHSASAFSRGSRAATIARLRIIQRHHQRTNGWADIGYHYLIDPDGRVWEGRELRWQGAHAGDPQRNRHNVGICLLGNYMPGDQGPPPPTQIRALQQLIVALMRRHGIAAHNLLTHRDLRDTDCPGPYLHREVARLRTRLRDLDRAASR